MKRLLLALLIGCVLTFVPVTAFKMPSEAGLSHLLKNGADALLFPGYVVALALSLGRFHDIRFGVVVFANVAIYAGFAYLVLTRLTKFKSKLGGGGLGIQPGVPLLHKHDSAGRSFTYDALRRTSLHRCPADLGLPPSSADGIIRHSNRLTA